MGFLGNIYLFVGISAAAAVVTFAAITLPIAIGKGELISDGLGYWLAMVGGALAIVVVAIRSWSRHRRRVEGTSALSWNPAFVPWVIALGIAIGLGAVLYSLNVMSRMDREREDRFCSHFGRGYYRIRAADAECRARLPECVAHGTQNPARVDEPTTYLPSDPVARAIVLCLQDRVKTPHEL